MSSSSFPVFLEQLKSKMKQVFRELNSTDPFTKKRGVPDLVLSEIMPLVPLSVVIPKEFGGRGGRIEENLLMTSAAAYESLAFSLTLGINSALFLQPVIKYAKTEVKTQVLSGFINEKKMGGLMITEPDFGSDALNMQTYFTKENEHYHLKGTKHWAGLTGFANYWLLTGREQTKSGQLKRDIDFFICDVKSPGQEIIVEEYFDNLGLHHIPYGRNIIDVKIPKLQRLEPISSGINVLLDVLHRSRLQFPAMGLGFIQRMMDEAIEHTKQRNIGGKCLAHYDQVQYRLARMQAFYTICSSMCSYSSENAGIENDLSTCGLEGNSFKSFATDMMQEAAQSLVQLVGAKAYRYSHIGGRGIIDSRPFQIFEGSNDMLYAQITESLMKQMKQAKEQNLYLFLKNFRFTKNAASLVKEQLIFDLNPQLSQRKMVDLGQIISRIVAMQMVIEMGEKNYRKDLINNAISILRADISGIMGHFKQVEKAQIIEDYMENSSWGR
ncbi:MAG: acyl-CoA dehydrogenase family protein [Bacteroidetes bacterium]|nr:acyl-CoA dehydrogenase family protein [Bacteroidota bacterium]